MLPASRFAAFRAEHRGDLVPGSMADGGVPTRRAAGGPVAGRPAAAAALLFAVGIALHPLLPPRPAVGLALLGVILLSAWWWMDRQRLASALLAAGLTVAGVAAAQLAAFYYDGDHVAAYAGDDPRLAQLELHI